MRLWLALLVCGCAGCHVLSKNESNSVQSLARALTAASSMPADFSREYYEIALDAHQLGIAAETDGAEKIKALHKLVELRTEADNTVKGYGAGYGILKQYAGLLLALSDTGHLKELNRRKNAFIPAFDTLVARYNSYNPNSTLPVASLGKLVGTLLGKVGSHRIRFLQRKYLSALVAAADPIVQQITAEYKVVDFYMKSAMLRTLGSDIDLAYTSFVRIREVRSHGQTDPFDYYTLYDPIFLSWINKTATLSAFNLQTTATLKKIGSTHKKLAEAMEKKASIKDVFKQLVDLYSSVNEMKEKYEDFKKDLNPVK